MEEKKVLFLPLLLLGLAMELITGTMGAADNSMPMASTINGDLETSPDQAPSTSPTPPHFPPSSAESASPVSPSSPSPSSGAESLVCWSCSSSMHGNPCYNIDPENATYVDSKTCAPEETFCSVVHIWYVVETTGEKENVNFSVNRTCSAECNPACMVIGDRTKIHSCTSCCTESHCNTESSSSTKQTSSIALLMSAFILALAPMLSVSDVPTVPNGQNRNSSNNNHKPPLDPTAATTFSKVFLSSSHRQLKGGCQHLTVVEQYTSKFMGTFQALFSFIPSTFSLFVSARVSSKSFDNF